MNKFLAFLSIGFLLSCSAQKKDVLYISNNRCEFGKNPLGIETNTPRLSWEINSEQRGVRQAAYRILVSDNREDLQKGIGNMWDSDTIQSDQSLQIAYGGKKLKAAGTYFWKVMVWDNKGNVSAWSMPAQWQMGLPTMADWKNASWIAYEKLPPAERIVPAVHGKGDKAWSSGKNTLPLFRKEFEITDPLRRATLYISGLGHFEASINGKKVGDHFLDPGWTDYGEHALYVTFDITQYLKKGGNAIGVMLGNGFYHIPRERYRKLTGSFGYPKMICRMVIEYENGMTDDIVSDASWTTAPGPVTFSSIYGGEDYDARLELNGWTTPDFRENASWKKALIVQGPQELTSQLMPPVKVHEKFSPRKISQPTPGKWVYDLGQNASGIVSITVKGEKGSVIKITPGELLNEDGEVSQKATGSPYYFKYTLKGEGEEKWAPRFTYYGFRYVQIEGGVPKDKDNPDNLPVVLNLRGLHIRSSTEAVGEFSCSEPLFNKTRELIDWAIKSNMMSVFTDCPHREKLGWLEQVHLMGNSIRYEYDIATMGRKIIEDMKRAQTSSGLIPNIAPEFVEFNFNGNRDFQDSPEWGSTGVILPWYLYRWYGDRQALEGSYPMMVRYIEYLKSRLDDHILYHGLGDWYDLGPERPGLSQHTPEGVTATAVFYYDLQIMIKAARLLGKPEDVSRYQTLAEKIKEAFNARFFNEETRQYATGSQTANAMAVYMGLVEPEFKNDVVGNIVKDIKARNNSLTSGDIGYRYLLQVLNQEGYSALIYAMNNRSDVPGYGYQIAQGATALTESWQGLRVVSNNHFMLGHLLEWFYSGLVGIYPAEDAIAFNEITIKPQPVGDITSAQASHHSPYGLIAAEWKKTKDTFDLKVRIPANTSATVLLPAEKGAAILEGDKSIEGNEQIDLQGYESGRAVIVLGSGSYHFKVLENKEISLRKNIE